MVKTSLLHSVTEGISLSQHISSADALVAPTINPNVFDFTFGELSLYWVSFILMYSLKDREVLKMGIKVAQRIAGTSPLSGLIENVANPTTDNLDSYINENIEMSSVIVDPDTFWSLSMITTAGI